MSNSTKIQCANCQAILKPNKETMQKIGTIGGGAGAFMAFIVIKTFGIIGLIFAFIIGFTIMCVVVVNTTKFEIVND